jgi:hypothetical protein
MPDDSPNMPTPVAPPPPCTLPMPSPALVMLVMLVKPGLFRWLWPY